MSKVVFPKATFENLVKHLVEIEEDKNKLLKQYFPGTSKERNEIEKLIEDYIKHVDQLIRNIKQSQTTERIVPFVTIGSEVNIQDLSDQKVFKYRIVSPFHGSIREGDIMYLSPVGKSLLLKKVGDIVKVDAPGGVFHYRIKSIQLQGDNK